MLGIATYIHVLTSKLSVGVWAREKLALYSILKAAYYFIVCDTVL